ncbi:MAG: SIMPL domain-containing protein [Rhizobacter sp.]|nr:SIMPL domain-containing protein [Chlorobiales bacterium]
MKKIILLTPLLIFIASAASSLTSAQSKNDLQDVRTIAVSGDAEVKVVPDEVLISIGVETENKNLDAARSENDRRTGEVLASLKAMNIDPKYIQTDYLSAEPRYEYESGTNRKKEIFYAMRKTIDVTLKDLSKLESLVSKVLSLGANSIYQVQFRTTELRKHKDQARMLAVRAAREKAQAMAKELGQNIGKPREVREVSEYYSPWYSNRYGRGRDMRTQNVMQDDGGSGATEGSVAIGQISIRAQVSITFELQ